MKIFFLKMTVIVALLLVYSCSDRKTAVVALRELPFYVQDTLKKLPVDEFGCYPDLIDFTKRFYYKSTTIGPWEGDQYIVDSINHISYSFSYDTPRPFIVTSTFIAFPVDYVNSLNVFNTDSTLFNVIYVKKRIPICNILLGFRTSQKNRY